MFTFLMLCLMGVIVGILGAILGIGGGIIMVPVLTFIFNFPIHISIATSLVVIMANSLSASSSHIKSGALNLPLGILLSIFSILGALLASSVALLLKDSTMMVLIAIMQVIFAIITFIKIKDNKKENIGQEEDLNSKNIFASSYYDYARKKDIFYKPIRLYLSAIAAFISGIFAGISGAGGGALITPAMNAFSKVPLKVATSTSIFIIGFSAAAATLIFFLHGNVDSRAACFIMLGVIGGTKLAIAYFSKITDAWVSYLLIIILLLSSLKMVHGAISFLGE